MCGLAGIFGLEGLDDPAGVTGRMTNVIAHRGPDADGIHVKGQVALGHRRLCIIDPDRASDQPFRSADGSCTLVFNGEIYNYRQLRRELEQQGVRFRTASDTEVLLAAYMHWGAECLHRLEGMFAFAVHDERRQELFIARDRLGIKPLYHHQGDRHFVFASEIRALLASGLVPKRLDHASLVDHLRYQTVHAPATIVKDVRMLLPGHYMVVGDQDVKVQRWWDMNSFARRDAAQLDRGQVERGIRERLGRAVEKRMVADVPFGAFLSGGIDSSAVVGLMAQASEQPVHTFSVSFNEEEFSEEKYALMVAKKFRTEHTPIRLRPQDLLEALPEILAGMDHPSADGPNTWMVSRATRKAGITMALSGLGGDELFAGYPFYKHVVALWEKRWITQFPIWMRAIGREVLVRARPRFARSAWSEAMLLGSFTVDSTYPLARLQATDRTLLALLKDRQLPADRVRSIMHRLIRQEGGHDLPFLAQVMMGELSTYLPNVLLRDTDQMSMAHALEVRVPFLDHDLVEFMLGVSDRHRYPHTPKQLLVSALGDLLPPEIVDRRKMGFVMPWERWMRNELKEMCSTRMSALAKREVFRPGAIEGIWRSFLAGDTNWYRVWSLVVLEDWIERHGIEA